MSEPTEPAVTDPVDQNAPAEPAKADDGKQKPPWGSDDDFDPAKAWKLIEGLKADKERLQARPVLTDEQKHQLDEYNALIEASKSDLERANEQVTRWQTEAEKWRASSVSSRVQALAADSFADPSDAVTALNDNNYLDSGGVIDDAAIKADLAALLERKPHFRKIDPDSGKPRVPAPNPAQGASGNAPTAGEPRDMFAALLKQQLNTR